MSLVKKLFKWLFIGMLALLFLLAVVLTIMQIKPFEKLPFIGGYKPLVVLGGSMEPAIKVGSVVAVAEIDPEQVRAGDIITFKTPVESNQPNREEQLLTTHRVIKISNQKDQVSFETKGDANEDPDNWRISESDILGKAVLAIPYLGYFIHFVRGPVGFILLVIIPGLLIIAIEIKNILSQLRIARGMHDV